MIKTASSLFHLHPVSIIAANTWGQIWVTDFRVGQGAFVNHSGSRRVREAPCLVLRTDKPMSYQGFEKSKHRPVRGLDARVGAGRCSAPPATPSASWKLLQVVLLEVAVGAKDILSVPPASFVSCLIAASSISRINPADLGLR